MFCLEIFSLRKPLSLSTINSGSTPTFRLRMEFYAFSFHVSVLAPHVRLGTKHDTAYLPQGSRRTAQVPQEGYARA